MRARGTFSPGDLPGTEQQLVAALRDAGLPPGQARAWLSSAASRTDVPAEWSFDYDDDLQLASFEVWVDGRMVFGLDDWLPRSAPPA